MRRLAEALDRLGHFPGVMADLAVIAREMRAIAADAPHASLVRWWLSIDDGSREYRPLSLMPILNGSGISNGIAVGWHSASSSVSWQVGDHRDGRLLAGQMIHDVKTYDTARWDLYPEDIHRLGALATVALASSSLAAEPDLLVAVPSSRNTNTLPHAIARDIGFLVRIPVAEPETVRFTRPVAQAKEMRDYWRKCELLRNAMEADRSSVDGLHVMVIDDVCRSGATLRECARSCLEAGAAVVTVLSITKSWSFQRIPSRFQETPRALWGDEAAIEPYDAL